MFDQKFITEALSRSAENPLDRRILFRAAGIAGIGGAAALLASSPAQASGHKMTKKMRCTAHPATGRS